MKFAKRKNVRSPTLILNAEAKKRDQIFRSGFKIDIVFGMPKYDCRFHGICKLDLDENDLVSPILPQCGRAKGWLLIPDPHYCLICFDKGSMTLGTANFHFARNKFEIKNDLNFEQALNRRIGYQISLLSGLYRINEKQRNYSVLFRISCSAI